ncbi:MAG TPA: heme exporter protein CcmB [Candidatus Krumholzibacteria bacterium]|nr:heme exporter protein CcmB [Candidatus Krumholzibacteria bacterium]
MLHTAAAVLWKDLKIEMRTRDAVSAAFVFAILVLVVFNFALGGDTPEMRRLAAGFFWVAFAFSGTLALNRSSAIEKESGAGRALALAPVDAGGVYLGKFFANAIFLIATQLAVLPLFIIFFDVTVEASRIGWLAASFILGAIGFAAPGTLFSVVAANTRMRELMLPLLFIPASVPALIAAVETTSFALGGTHDASFWFKLLLVYDVVFVTASLLVFEYALEE